MIKIKEFLKKLQEKPEDQRKKILWKGVAVVGFLLMILFIIQTKSNFSKTNISDSLPETGNIKDDFGEIGETLEELKNESNENLEELEELNKNLEDLENLEEEKKDKKDSKNKQ